MRPILVVFLLLLSVLWCRAASAEERRTVDLIDAAGRSVSVEVPLRRVVLGDAWDVLTLNLLLDDPIAPVVGWVARERVDAGTAEAFRKRFPAFDAVASLGVTSGEVSLSRLRALAPEAFLAGSGYDPADPKLAEIEAAGIPVVFLAQPGAMTGRTGEAVQTLLALLGPLLGADERARAVAGFHSAHLGVIAGRLKTTDRRPPILLEAHAGSADCCWSPGGRSDYVDFAGATNIGTPMIGGYGGKLTLRYVASADPALVIGTGGMHMRRKGGLVLGPGISAEEASASLERTMARPGFAGLPAVEAGRVYGFWHQMIGTPLEAAALEAMARWIHPDLFADLDPKRTLADLNRLFAAVPMDGAIFVEPARKAAGRSSTN